MYSLWNIIIKSGVLSSFHVCTSCSCKRCWAVFKIMVFIFNLLCCCLLLIIITSFTHKLFYFFFCLFNLLFCIIHFRIHFWKFIFLCIFILLFWLRIKIKWLKVLNERTYWVSFNLQVSSLVLLNIKWRITLYFTIIIFFLTLFILFTTKDPISCWWSFYWWWRI